MPRIGLSLVAVIGAVLLLAGSPAIVAAVLAVPLGAAGLGLMDTVALGHCQLHAKLGPAPAALT